MDVQTYISLPPQSAGGSTAGAIGDERRDRADHPGPPINAHDAPCQRSHVTTTRQNEATPTPPADTQSFTGGLRMSAGGARWRSDEKI